MPPGHKVSQIPSKVSVSKAATSHKVNESESLYSKQIARVGYPALFNTSSVYVITADHHQPEQVLSTERLNNARAEETVALNLCRETKFQLEGRHSWNWKSESKIDQFSQVQASEVEVESNTRPAIWDWTQNPKLKVAASNPRNNKVHLEQRNDLGGQRVTSFLLSNSSETMWNGTNQSNFTETITALFTPLSIDTSELRLTLPCRIELCSPPRWWNKATLVPICSDDSTRCRWQQLVESILSIPFTFYQSNK